MKKCTKCLITKDYIMFNKSGAGYQQWCKDCRKQYHKIYSVEKKDSINKYGEEWRAKNKERIALRMKQYDSLNKEKIAERKRLHYLKNKDKILEKTRAYAKSNKDKINAYRKNQKSNSIEHTLIANLRGSLYKHIKSKKSSSLDYVGCSKDELLSHLLSSIPIGFSLDNYLNRKNYPIDLQLDIDHKIPFKYFIDNGGLTEENLYKVMHYTNLRFLPASVNRSKGGIYSLTI